MGYNLFGIICADVEVVDYFLRQFKYCVCTLRIHRVPNDTEPQYAAQCLSDGFGQRLSITHPTYLTISRVMFEFITSGFRLT